MECHAIWLGGGGGGHLTILYEKKVGGGIRDRIKHKVNIQYKGGGDLDWFEMKEGGR